MEQECKWEADDDGIYQTECGDAFVFDTDTPKENSFKFCCFCGGTLVDVTKYESFSMAVSLPVEASETVTCTLYGVGPK